MLLLHRGYEMSSNREPLRTTGHSTSGSRPASDAAGPSQRSGPTCGALRRYLSMNSKAERASIPGDRRRGKAWGLLSSCDEICAGGLCVPLAYRECLTQRAQSTLSGKRGRNYFNVFTTEKRSSSRWVFFEGRRLSQEKIILNILGAAGEISGLGYFLKRFSKAWRASVWRGGPAGGAEPGAGG